MFTDQTKQQYIQTLDLLLDKFKDQLSTSEINILLDMRREYLKKSNITLVDAINVLTNITELIATWLHNR